MIELNFTGESIVDINQQIAVYLSAFTVSDNVGAALNADTAPKKTTKGKGKKSEPEASIPTAAEVGETLGSLYPESTPMSVGQPQPSEPMPMPTFAQMHEQPQAAPQPQPQAAPMAPQPQPDYMGATQAHPEISNADLNEVCRKKAASNPALDAQIRQLIVGYTQETGLPPMTANIPLHYRAAFVQAINALA